MITMNEKDKNEMLFICTECAEGDTAGVHYRS